MKYRLIPSLVAILFTNFSNAAVSFNDSLVGTWKGTSICQVRPSPCNDEIAVYHFTKTENPNIYHIVLNKLVNGKEEEMGENDFTFDPADHSLSCYIKEYDVAVKLNVKGDSIEGTLISRNQLYRIIKLKKEN